MILIFNLEIKLKIFEMFMFLILKYEIRIQVKNYHLRILF